MMSMPVAHSLIEEGAGGYRDGGEGFHCFQARGLRVGTSCLRPNTRATLLRMVRPIVERQWMKPGQFSPVSSVSADALVLPLPSSRFLALRRATLLSLHSGAESVFVRPESQWDRCSSFSVCCEGKSLKQPSSFGATARDPKEVLSSKDRTSSSKSPANPASFSVVSVRLLMVTS